MRPWRQRPPGDRRQNCPIGQLIYRLKIKRRWRQIFYAPAGALRSQHFSRSPSRCSFRCPRSVVGREFSTVVIDAGHGGFDRGGIPGQRVPEKIVALDVAQRLEKDCARPVTGWS